MRFTNRLLLLLLLLLLLYLFVFAAGRSSAPRSGAASCCGKGTCGPCDASSAVEPCSGKLSAKASRACSRTSSKRDSRKQARFDEQSAAASSQSAGATMCSHPSSVGSHHTDAAKGKSPKKAKLCPLRRKSREKNRKKKGNDDETPPAWNGSTNWNVTNISERCSIFEYKEKMLKRRILSHHKIFTKQVGSAPVFCVHYFCIIF